MKYPSQNTFPIPSIVEGYKRNSVVKLHKQKRRGRKMKFIYEIPPQNDAPSLFIVEGCERNTVVKVHKQKDHWLCRTEKNNNCI